MNDPSPSESRHPEVLVEGLHVRNHGDDEHVLWVRAITEDGTADFKRSYRLSGYGSASELDVLGPGTYDVEVELDGLRRWVQRCDLTHDPTRGLLIGTGNGTVSVTTRNRNPTTVNGN